MRRLDMETILQFKNLDYYYESNGKNVAILENVNFSFQKDISTRF